MTEVEFFKYINDLLEDDYEISMETNLEDLDDWDSLSYVAFLAGLSPELRQNIEGDCVRQAKTVGDLYSLVKTNE